MAVELEKAVYTNSEVREIVQKLIDICFSCGLITFSGDTKEKAAWIAQQLRLCGFDTKPVGASWGMLIKRGAFDNDK